MSGEGLPQGGDLRRGAWWSGMWRPDLRLETDCCRCGRRIVVWRDMRNPGQALRCNGEDKQACGALVSVRKNRDNLPRLRAARAELQERQKLAAAEAALRRAEPPRQIRAQDAAAQERRAAADRVREQAEAERLRRCPRPDKEVWLTLEAAQWIVRLMRDQGRPNARDLHGYLCACGGYHVGNRTKLAGDAATERWGPAEGAA